MLRKRILLLIIAAIAVLLTAAPCMANDEVYDYYKIVKLVIGQKEAEVNYKPALMDQPAYVKSGRTLVPFRFLGESLGAQVTWDAKGNRATLKLAGTEVIVVIGSKTAYVNGKMTAIDVPAETKGGRTFIPLRFASEALGAGVNYETETQTVTVRYIDTTGWKTFTGPKSGLEYEHPSDWTVKTDNDDQIVIFTSPRGSQMWTYVTSDNMTEVNKVYKKQYEESGWTLISESLDDPENIAEGFELRYQLEDPKTKKWFYSYIWVDPMSDVNEVAEVVVDETTVDYDYDVMLHMYLN